MTLGGRVLVVLLAVSAAGCSRPSSREFFVMREKAEYGDTYSFTLDLSDTTISYSLEFFTRLERTQGESFPSEDITLDLRWFSPLDSIRKDTLLIKVDSAVGDAVFSRDILTPYSFREAHPEAGEWRLKAKVVNDSETIRGLGVILREE